MLVIHLKCIALFIHMAAVVCPLHAHLNGIWAANSSQSCPLVGKVSNCSAARLLVIWVDDLAPKDVNRDSTPFRSIAHWTHGIIGVERTVNKSSTDEIYLSESIFFSKWSMDAIWGAFILGRVSCCFLFSFFFLETHHINEYPAGC